VIRPHSSPSPSSPWPARLKKDRILRGPSALCGARTCRWFAPLRFTVSLLGFQGFPRATQVFSFTDLQELSAGVSGMFRIAFGLPVI